MRKWIARAIWLVLSVVGWIVWDLVKDAVAGWSNTQLQKRWEMIDPAVQDYLLFTWLPPIVLMAAIAASLWYVYRLGAQAVPTSNVPEPHGRLPVESPAQQISPAQRSYVQNEFSKLNTAQVTALRRIRDQGHGKNIPDQEWQPLEAVAFVTRDIIGKQGINPEVRTEIEYLLSEEVEGQSTKPNPIILVELETVVSPIGNLTPACAVRITNMGPELERKCLVQIEDHGLKIHMPDPFVIRTEGQIRGRRTGRFTLSKGQPKLVPILYRVPAHIGEFRFIGEDEKNYSFTGDSAEFVVAIYGADSPIKVRIRISDGNDLETKFEMENC